MALGINPTKGYGFIRPDTGGPDVFVHISAVEKAGYAVLAEGARVSFELEVAGNDPFAVVDRGRKAAGNVSQRDYSNGGVEHLHEGRYCEDGGYKPRVHVRPGSQG